MVVDEIKENRNNIDKIGRGAPAARFFAENGIGLLEIKRFVVPPVPPFFNVPDGFQGQMGLGIDGRFVNIVHTKKLVRESGSTALEVIMKGFFILEKCIGNDQFCLSPFDKTKLQAE